MAKLLLKNGRVMDPASGRDETADVLIEEGRIAAVGLGLPADGAEVFDVSGKLVIPGAVDLHAHLRDMEQNAKETVETATRAALAGGVTTVVAMPNTMPVLDDAEAIRRYRKIIEKDARCRVHIAGAISRSLKGKALAAIEDYPALGIRIITDDGHDVDNETVLHAAFRKAAELNLIVMIHPEMMGLAPGAAVNEGAVSRKLGLAGQPNEKEWKAVERGIRLGLETGARVHFTHITTGESVALIREAKKKSDFITCDATPHHLTLTEEAVLRLGPLAKVNPPLRTEKDRLALIAAVKDGTVDCLVTDHAPHEEKDPDIAKAAFGFSGIEMFIPAAITELYHGQGMDLMRVIGLFTDGPNRVTGWDRRAIAPGHPADLTVIDLNAERTVHRQKLLSKGKNTPFDGMALKGWPAMTICGNVIHEN